MSFNCGDLDISEYLIKDSWRDRQNLFSQTYLWRQDGQIRAYCSVVNDNLQRQALPEKDQAKYSTKVPYSHYPAVKLARLGVSHEFQGKGLGRHLIISMALLMSRHDNKTGCRFMVLDAYKDRVAFYEKIGFRRRIARGSNHTVPMYLDLKPFRALG